MGEESERPDLHVDPLAFMILPLKNAAANSSTAAATSSGCYLLLPRLLSPAPPLAQHGYEAENACPWRELVAHGCST